MIAQNDERDVDEEDLVECGAQESETARALRFLAAPGQVTEMRVMGVDGKKRTDSGYFDDMKKLAQAAARYDGRAEAVYITLNPVNPDLLARANNRMKEWAKNTTNDREITGRRWLLIDCDPVRPSGISSTQDEYKAAERRAQQIHRTLQAEGWPIPVAASSGNGFHLLYRIDRPCDDDRLVERVLKALAFRFDDDTVQVDTSVHNPARLCKLYGTMACKGDDTPERPHCRAELVYVPSDMGVVTPDLLEAVAATLPEEATKGGGKSSQQISTWQPPSGGFDLEGWIERHELDVDGPYDWQKGRKWVFDVCPWNEDHTNRSAYILQFPSGAIAAGCHHNGCSEKKWHDLRDVVESFGSDDVDDSIEECPTPPTMADYENVAAFDGDWRSSEPIAVEGVGMTRLSDVEPEQISWLWKGFTPLGKLSVLDGDPGLGKSTITYDIAARVTRGLAMPDGTASDLDGPAGVILLAAEDGLADTIVPRLLAAGGDTSRVYAIEVMGTGEKERMPTLADYKKVEETIIATGAKLVIVDPLMAYLPSTTNAHHDQDIRRVLTPLKEVAERTGAAILVVRHLNKGMSANVLYRGGGSIGIIGAARSGLIVAPDPQDETGTRRILAVQKMNIAAKAGSLLFRVEDNGAGDARIAWLGVSSQTADSLFAPTEDTEGGQMGDAKAFLRDVLSDGPVAANDAKEAAKEAGIAGRTLERAKKALGVISKKQGFDGGFVWSLPSHEDCQLDRRPPTDTEDRQLPEDGDECQSAA